MLVEPSALGKGELADVANALPLRVRVQRRVGNPVCELVLLEIGKGDDVEGGE